MMAKAYVDWSRPNDVHHLQVQVRQNIHLIFSPAGLGHVQVTAPQVKFQAFGQDSGPGGLVGVLLRHLEEVEFAQRLEAGLAEVLWSRRVGVEEGSVEKLVVGELR